jgi:gamma-glutamyltranspeptidase/glutathione hydrolase
VTAPGDLQQRFPSSARPPALAAEAMVSSSHPTVSRATGGNRGAPVVVGGPWSAGGGAQVISLDHRRGYLVGGSDSRQEGVALGA